MSIDFMNPIYYDVNDITDDMPNKELLKSLFEAMNEQNERLWMFFTDMVESPDYKPMSARSIMPRTLRKKKAAPKAIDKVDSDEFMEGYKAFMKEEFDAS